MELILPGRGSQKSPGRENKHGAIAPRIYSSFLSAAAAAQPRGEKQGTRKRKAQTGETGNRGDQKRNTGGHKSLRHAARRAPSLANDSALSGRALLAKPDGRALAQNGLERAGLERAGLTGLALGNRARGTALGKRKDANTPGRFRR